MTEASINELSKLIKQLKFPVDRDSFVKKLQEQIKTIARNSDNGKITPQIEELMLFGLVAKISPNSLILPNKALAKKFFFIKIEALQGQLEEDYYSMEMQEQLGNLYEVARFAHIQIENVVNCALAHYDVISAVKSYDEHEYFWVQDFNSSNLTKKHPAVYLLGEDKDKWKNYNAPSDTALSYLKKLVIFFAFCVNDAKADGHKDGLIDDRLFKEINEIKKLRDKASHRFSTGNPTLRSVLLQMPMTDAFLSIKRTLNIFFKSSIPKGLK